MHKTSAALILAMHLRRVPVIDWNYVITKRLVYAQKLLWGGSSVTEACYESGFRDYAHFIKSFTKTFGCSPKQCKKEDSDVYMMKLNL